MRLRTWTLVGAAGVALAFAGVAVALHSPGSAGPASATGSATTATGVTTTTCSANSQNFELTRGTYNGSASSSNPLLAGPISIKVTSWLDTSAGNVGLLRALFRISNSGHTSGLLTAVNSNGSLTGWVDARASGGKRFAGTFSGTWSKSTGFGALSIGTSTSNNAVVTFSGHCGSGEGDDDQGQDH